MHKRVQTLPHPRWHSRPARATMCRLTCELCTSSWWRSVPDYTALRQVALAASVVPADAVLVATCWRTLLRYRLPHVLVFLACACMWCAGGVRYHSLPSDAHVSCCRQACVPAVVRCCQQRARGDTSRRGSSATSSTRAIAGPATPPKPSPGLTSTRSAGLLGRECTASLNIDEGHVRVRR